MILFMFFLDGEACVAYEEIEPQGNQYSNSLLHTIVLTKNNPDHTI